MEGREREGPQVTVEPGPLRALLRHCKTLSSHHHHHHHLYRLSTASAEQKHCQSPVDGCFVASFRVEWMLVPAADSKYSLLISQHSQYLPQTRLNASVTITTTLSLIFPRRHSVITSEVMSRHDMEFI